MDNSHNYNLKSVKFDYFIWTFLTTIHFQNQVCQILSFQKIDTINRDDQGSPK